MVAVRLLLLVAVMGTFVLVGPLAQPEHMLELCEALGQQNKLLLL